MVEDDREALNKMEMNTSPTSATARPDFLSYQVVKQLSPRKLESQVKNGM